MKQITVGELKEFLDDFPDHYTVIMSKDGEGNLFSPMSGGVAVGNYEPENPFLGDFEFNDDKASSIVIFPVN